MGKRRIFYRLQIRMVFLFLAVMFLASVIALLVSYPLFFQSANQQNRVEQEHIAQNILLLAKQTGLSESEIANLVSTSTCQIEVVDDFADYQMDIKQDEQLKQQGYYYVDATFPNMGCTLVRLGESRFVIRYHVQGGGLQSTLSRMVLTSLITLILGLILMHSFSKRAFRPIETLQNAIQQVARGNFRVRVPETHRKDELGKVMKSFNKMADDLSNTEMLRNDFVSNVSHEFKTPLASIQGYTMLLENSGLNEEQRKYAKVIVDETRRLSKLTENVLRLTKLENQKEEQKKKKFFVDEQLRQCLVSLQSEWSSKEIQWDIQLDHVEYCGDEELLGQVWNNLVGNAIKFSQKGGTIWVRCYRKESAVQVVVGDQGIGMDSETQKRIFEKFYQGDPSHREQGNGLGLTLVKKIIDLFGGTIQVISQPGKGAVFTVNLPKEQ